MSESLAPRPTALEHPAGHGHAKPARHAMSVRRAILVLGVLAAFGPLSMDLYLPTLPELASSLGTSDTLAQATMSVCMIGLGLGQLVAGPLSDRLGRRRPLLVGVALFTAFSLACVFAPTIEFLLAARLMQGLSGAAGLVICFAVARDMYSGAELSRMLSLLALVTASAPILAPIAGGQLALIMDWRGLFGVLTGIGACLFLLALVGLRETLPALERHGGGLGTTFRHIGELRRDPVFLAILVASAAGGVAFFSYLSMSSFVLQKEFGLSPQLFAVVFALNALANMAGSQTSRALVMRLGPARMYLAGQTAMALAGAGLLTAAVLTSGVAGAAAWVLVLLAGFLFSSGLGGPNAMTLALDGHAERAGTASAVLGTAQFVVGPVVAPLAALGGATALTMAVTIAVASALAATIAWLVVRPRVSRRA